jgi:DNA-directed RNA polymerase specialized sigma subunit
MASPTWAADERSLSVRLWITSLPQRFQQVYSLLYVHGATQREAARAMGISQPRVAQLHQELLALGRQGFASLAA